MLVSFNIASVVLGLKLPSVTGYCSHFTVIKVLFSFVSFISYVSLIKSLFKKGCAIKEADFVCQSWQIWKATMGLCFSILCALHSTGTSLCEAEIHGSKICKGMKIGFVKFHT